jgi:hypothetical protein
MARRRRDPVVGEHDGVDANASDWQFLAGAIHKGGDVFIASDNAPARDELARRIAERGGTACYVGHDDLGHSSYHDSSADDDHAMTDWWTLSRVTDAIVMVSLPCAGKTAISCHYKRGCETRRGPNGCRASSFSITARKLLGTARYVGTEEIPHAVWGGPRRRGPRPRREPLRT